MTKDQKSLLEFQLDNIIDLADSITPEKQIDLIKRIRAYVDTLSTGKKKKIENPQKN